MHARLDKLLSEILAYADTLRRSSLATELSLVFQVDVSNAKNLRRAWRQRFREQYIIIDQQRSNALIQGQLKDVLFNIDAAPHLNTWKTEAFGPISNLEVNLQFEPGQ